MTRNRQVAIAGLIALFAVAGCEAGQETEQPAGEPEDVRAAEIEAGARELAPIDHSGVTGTVRADRDDENVTITLTVQGLQSGVEYSAHVHQGRCAAGGPVVLPLGDLNVTEAGEGRARLRTGADRIPADSDAFVQVHGSGGRPVACVDLGDNGGEEALVPSAATPGGPAPADAATDTSSDG